MGVVCSQEDQRINEASGLKRVLDMAVNSSELVRVSVNHYDGSSPKQNQKPLI